MHANKPHACREYKDFRVSTEGQLQGVGLLIAQDPASGHLVVLAPIKVCVGAWVGRGRAPQELHGAERMLPLLCRALPLSAPASCLATKC